MAGNTNSKNLKKAVIEALRKHPEGLTIRDISETVGHHRHTVTKYVYELIGAQVIYERDIGAAKLCYLRENYNGFNGKKNKKGQVQLIAVLMLLLLVPATVIVAQNMTNSSNYTGGLEGMMTASNVTGDEPQNPAESNEPVYEENITLDNETIIETINETINETFFEPNITEPNVTIPNVTEPVINETNITVPNETVPVENLTFINETLNETGNVTNGTIAEPENITTSEIEEPELAVNIIAPDKITRGEETELFAVVDNRGSKDARNVKIEWLLPEFFTVKKGALSDECGYIAANYSCTSAVTVFANTDSRLGLDVVRVRVSYAA